MDIALISKAFFGLIGGLGMFLYGMKLMSEGLQKTSGDSLKKILEKLTSNRVIGTGVGAIVTVAIQSSSATTVMVVGFVNAGLMNLTQALSVILGANIGTTITAQIIAFKITAISLPAIGIGVGLYLFAQKPMLKYTGEIIFGFGLLFFGMDIMTSAFIPLSKAEWFKDIFVHFSHWPILAVMAGAITTLLVQSSSATIGITIALATTGVLDFQAAAALVLGENIGTTITANLAAISASRTAKQAALGHFLFNFIGVTYMMILLYPFLHFINSITPGEVSYMTANGTYPNMARHIANIHTMFNIINTVVFLPFIPILAKLCERIIKPDPHIKGLPKLVHLSNALTSTPEIAVGVAKNEVIRMFRTSLDILEHSKNALLYKNTEAATLGKNMQEHADMFDKEIASFLERLSMKPLSERSEAEVRNMSHIIGEIRQIGERSQKIIKLSQKLVDKNITFTGDAESELHEIFNNVSNFTNKVYNLYSLNKKATNDLEQEEDLIDRQRKLFKKNHLTRLNQGSCSIDAGLLFVDILNTLEKIGDDAFSITQIFPQN